MTNKTFKNENDFEHLNLLILGHISCCAEIHLGIEVKVGLSDLESQVLIVKMDLLEYDLVPYLVSGLIQQGKA